VKTAKKEPNGQPKDHTANQLKFGQMSKIWLQKRQSGNPVHIAKTNLE